MVKKKLSFEDAMARLREITETLERGSVTLHIQMRCSDESGMVTITVDGQTFSIPISSTLSWYTVELPVTACDFFNINITCASNLIINSYYTE